VVVREAEGRFHVHIRHAEKYLRYSTIKTVILNTVANADYIRDVHTCIPTAYNYHQRAQ